MKHITTFLLFATFAAFGALAPSTTFNEISGTNTIADIVSAGGGGGGGGTDGQAVTNIVKGLTDAPLASKRGIYDYNAYSTSKDNRWGFSYWYLFLENLSLGVSAGERIYFVPQSADWESLYWSGDEGEITSSNGQNFNVVRGSTLYTFTATELRNSNNFISVETADGWHIEVRAYYEQLATTATVQPLVTNVVRDVLGTVYDAELKVTWKQVMHDGNLYYVAVTNANITEVSE